jgi:hypothetical protein
MNQVDLFTEAEKEHYEERSAIREESGESREKAEAEAAQEVMWERERFRCMVRKLLQWKASGDGRSITEWLAAQKNPRDYIEAAGKQWQLGNVGVHPDWRGE